MSRLDNKSTIVEKSAEWAHKECTVKGCTNKRMGVSRYCKRHYYHVSYFGHPDGRKIRPKEYSLERAKADIIIDNNLDNEAIQWGIGYFDRWLQNATEDIPGIMGADYMARMAEEGVTGKVLLREALAMMIFYERYPDVIPTNEGPEPLQIALALAVMLYRVQPHHGGVVHRNHVKLSRPERRTIGQQLWMDLGKLLVQVSRAVIKDDRKKEGKLEAAKHIQVVSE